jgi:hypothetical protein
MMNTLKIYQIIRKTGWFKRCYGIKIDQMHQRHQDILTQNRYIKRHSDDDRFIQALFYIADMEAKDKFKRTWWPNPYTNKITKYSEVIKSYDVLKWPCAICGNEIDIKIGDYKWKSFCCTSCKKNKLPKQMNKLDDRIVNSSLAFTKHCKKILQKRQASLIRKVKKNS